LCRHGRDVRRRWKRSRAGTDLPGDGGTAFADQPSVSRENPAKARDTILIDSTWLGEVDITVPASTPALGELRARTVNPVTLTIGGREADVSYAGLAPGLAGVYQVIARIPDGVGPSTPFRSLSRWPDRRVPA
jgi:uncharacterized protein (TIGR03437 family)